MRTILAVALLFAAATSGADEAADLRAARTVFEANIEAIRQKDRDRYVSLYLPSERLVRVGPTGFLTGFEEFARGAGGAWPDTIEATEMRLTPLQPGMVYGTYRYRVRYGAREIRGISERIFVETPNGWKIALTGAIDTPPGTPPPPRAISGATLVDGRGGTPVPNAVVVVRDGKIDCAGTCDVPAGIDVVDARGMWITPGLVDAHVHFSQTGWADGRPDALDVRTQHPYATAIAALRDHPERLGRTHLCTGITAVFDVGGYPWTTDLARRFEYATDLPHVAAAGPLLSTLDHWLNLPAERQFLFIRDETSAREGVAYLASRGSRAVKVWYIEEAPAALETAARAAAEAKLPLIVHATELARAKAAVRAGASLLVHSVWDRPVDDELIALMKAKGTILNPTLTVMDGYVRMFRSVVSRTPPAIDDPNGCIDPVTAAKVASTASLDPSLVNQEQLGVRAARTAEREAIARANLARLVAAGIPIATGTDAGNPLTLHGPSLYAEMEAMQRAGMTPMQVIVASTATAARAAGLDDVTGTIEPGRSADLLLLAADPAQDVANFRKLRFVMRGGVLRAVEELSAMAQGERP